MRALSVSVILALAAISAVARASDIPKELLQQRDPFKMPVIKQESVSRSDLQMYSTDQFKLVGVLDGEKGLRAMVSSPNGKTYFVRKGTAIGTRGGVITQITDGSIVVREKFVNVLGDTENVNTVLKIPGDQQEVQTPNPQQGW